MAVSLKTGRKDMKLTQSSRLLAQQQQPLLPSSDDSFPTKQLFFLAICRVAEPIALTSIFPYAWLLIKSFNVGSSNNASFYAGILISAFSLSECLTGVFWGSMSDRFGRKPILLLGCAGTMLSMLVVGFAPNFWVALLGRVVGGILNGNIGVIQTMVGELVKKPEHEPRAYSVMPFVWSIGTILGPAIGGTFADPSKSFPSTFSADGIFAVFPYLLPNIICAALLMISIILGWIFLEETHPYLRLGLSPATVKEVDAVVVDAGAHGEETVNVRAESYGTFEAAQVQVGDEVEFDLTTEKPVVKEGRMPSMWTFRIVMLLVALGIFTYHSMTFDHLLPIFLQDGAEESASVASNLLPPGLGMTTLQVGTILSISGLSALFIQAVVFPMLASMMPTTRLLFIVTLLHPFAYFPMPFLAALPSSLVLPGVYLAQIYRNFTSIIAYPLLLILLKQACPSPTVLGQINGLAASVGAACRMAAPPVAGYLYGIGGNIGFTGLAWWGSGVVAIIGACQIFLVKRERAGCSGDYEAIPSSDVTVAVEAPQSDHVNYAVIHVELDAEA